jgi:hypothetical protein
MTEQPKGLRLTAVYKHDESEFGGTPGEGWYAAVYVPGVEGAAYSSPLFSLRRAAVEDAKTWCLTNHPGLKIIIA